jgi:hypothetical protein
MDITINVHPAMMNSPKELGELVINQAIREAEGKKKSIFEIETNNHTMVFDQIMGLNK